MGRARRIASAAVLALGGGGALALMPSCTVSSVDLSKCDYVVTRCQPVYSTWCDGYGCYPTYYEQCWQDCYVDPSKPDPGASPPATPVAPSSPSSPDAGGDAQAPQPPPPPAADAGANPNDALLCARCRSNDECGGGGGGLCILRGGASAQSGFCGRTCTGSAANSDCPTGYDCTAIGSSRVCVPASGACP